MVGEPCSIPALSLGKYQQQHLGDILCDTAVENKDTCHEGTSSRSRPRRRCTRRDLDMESSLMTRISTLRSVETSLHNCARELLSRSKCLYVDDTSAKSSQSLRSIEHDTRQGHDALRFGTLMRVQDQAETPLAS